MQSTWWTHKPVISLWRVQSIQNPLWSMLSVKIKIDFRKWDKTKWKKRRQYFWNVLFSSNFSKRKFKTRHYRQQVINIPHNSRERCRNPSHPRNAKMQLLQASTIQKSWRGDQKFIFRDKNFPHGFWKWFNAHHEFLLWHVSIAIYVPFLHQLLDVDSTTWMPIPPRIFLTSSKLSFPLLSESCTWKSL